MFDIEEPVKIQIPSKWITMSGTVFELLGREQPANLTLYYMYFNGQKATGYYIQPKEF